MTSKEASKEIVLGIDDAGRGPVIGPMVLAGVLIQNTEQDQTLNNLGVKDSKLLLPNKRKLLSEQVMQNFKHNILQSTPKEIDNHKNLNWLEAEKAARIINNLLKQTPPNQKAKIIIDCPSVNCQAWQDYLIQHIKPEIQSKISKISSEHKADLNHPIVSAASIIAKETREDELKILKKQLSKDFGSGYPADPTTKEFLEKNHSNPKFKDIIRFSWSTVKKLQKQSDEKQKRLF